MCSVRPGLAWCAAFAFLHRGHVVYFARAVYAHGGLRVEHSDVLGAFLLGAGDRADWCLRVHVVPSASEHGAGYGRYVADDVAVAVAETGDGGDGGAGDLEPEHPVSSMHGAFGVHGHGPFVGHRQH